MTMFTDLDKMAQNDAAARALVIGFANAFNGHALHPDNEPGEMETAFLQSLVVPDERAWMQKRLKKLDALADQAKKVAFKLHGYYDVLGATHEAQLLIRVATLQGLLYELAQGVTCYCAEGPDVMRPVDVYERVIALCQGALDKAKRLGDEKTTYETFEHCVEVLDCGFRAGFLVIPEAKALLKKRLAEWQEELATWEAQDGKSE